MLFLSRLEQYRVVVAEEVIAFGDGMGVGGADGVVAGEGRDQHEQRRFRQVEIGDQPVDDLEAVAPANCWG